MSQAEKLAQLQERVNEREGWEPDMSAAKMFRGALDNYIAARAEYNRAREAFGDAYDWDYFGARHIEALQRAVEEFDAAFVRAVSRSAAASLPERNQG